MSQTLDLLRDLMHQKAHANAALLRAVKHDEMAARDAELRRLLEHILLANRFWLLSCLGEPFAADVESRVPESLEELTDRYRATHAKEWTWVAAASNEDLARSVKSPLIPGTRCQVAQALMQVCLHSHGHRSQCATRLRALGGSPPAGDFILWLVDRPNPDWS